MRPVPFIALVATAFAATPLLLASGCAPAAAESETLREVEAFMASYAEDLIAADREALGMRYDPRGIHLIFNGENEFLSFDSIRAIYREGWEPPDGFTWDALTYEILGPDAVMVVGSATWESEGLGSLPLSYTGVLRRQEAGGWRIRLENEAIPPEALRPLLCPPAEGGG